MNLGGGGGGGGDARLTAGGIGSSGHSEGGAGGEKKSSIGSESSTSEASTIESSPKGEELGDDWPAVARGPAVADGVERGAEAGDAGSGEPGSTTVRWQ